MLLASASSLLLAAPPNDLDEVLIPLVAIIGGLSIPIVALILQFRKQQLQARLIERAIEQGLTIEEIDELLARQGFAEETAKKKESREVPFRKGFVLFAIGAAFFLAANPRLMGWTEGYGVQINPWFDSTGNFVGYLLMGLGVAFSASDLLALVFGARKDSD